MKPLAVSRMFHAAVTSAIKERFADPRTMAAVDLLSEPFIGGTPGLLAYLWNDPAGIYWGSLVGVEYSYEKQTAVLTISGKTWDYWTALTDGRIKEGKGQTSND